MANPFEKLKQELLAIGYEPTTVEQLMKFLNKRWGNGIDILAKWIPMWIHEARQLYDMFAPREMANLDLLKPFFHGAFAQESATYSYGDIKFNPVGTTTDLDTAIEQVYGTTARVATQKLGSGEVVVIPETFVRGIETLLEQQRQYKTEVNGEIVLHGIQNIDNERIVFLDRIEPYMIIATKLDIMQPDQWDNIDHLIQVISALATIKEDKWGRYLSKGKEEDIFSKTLPQSVYERLTHEAAEAGNDSIYQFLRTQSLDYFRTVMVDSIRERDRLTAWLSPESLQNLVTDAQARGFTDVYELLELDKTYLQNVSVASRYGIAPVTSNAGAINRTRIHTHPLPEEDEQVDAKIGEGVPELGDAPAYVGDHRRPSGEIGDLEEGNQNKMQFIGEDKTLNVNFEAIASAKDGVPSLTIYSIDPQKEYHVSILNLLLN